MKIGILTFHAADNHGGVLQCMALQNMVSQIIGSDNVEIVDFPLPGSNPIIDGDNTDELTRKRICRLDRFKAFRNNNLRLSDYTYKGADELKTTRYDAIIVGSDQVWNRSIISGLEDVYFLKWGSEACKISYAASIGYSGDSCEYALWLQNNTMEFDSISVREHSSVTLFGDRADRIAYCLDPTMLWDKTYWEKYEKKPDFIDDNAEYVFMYALGYPWNQNEEIMAANLASKIAKAEGLKICHNYWGDYKKRLPADAINCYFSDPAEFLWIMHHAKYVVCCSFHGTVFSLIYERPFYSVHTGGNGSRMMDLCKLAGVSNRCVDTESEFNAYKFEIDWDMVRKRLAREKESSLKYLKNALQGV